MADLNEPADAVLDSLRQVVDSLASLAEQAGVGGAQARAEAAALSAAGSAHAPGAAEVWAAAFGGRASGFAAAVKAGEPLSRGPSPVLARLVGAGSPLAADYAKALADLASAACAIGEPTLSSVATASVIAAAQLAAVPGVAPPVATPVAASPAVASPSVATPSVVTPASSPSGTEAAAAAPAAIATEPEPPPKTLAELFAELDDLIGLDSVKSEIRHQAQVLRVAKLRSANKLREPAMTRHLVFVGNPGTGKTTVARLVAGIYRALGVLEQGQLIECDRSSLVAGYVGQTALKTAEAAAKAVGGVLFIDEAYALAGDNYGSEAIETLVKQMEDHRDELVVIVAGYPAPMQDFIDTNPGLASRFRLTLDFADYTDDQLVDIFGQITSGSDFTPTAGCVDRLKQILTMTPRDTGFGNARFVRNLFEAAVVRQAWRLRDLADPGLADLRELTAEDLGPLPDSLHPPEPAMGEAP